ncbi:SDR family oxidoreductase [Fimbriiglobus ruber]|uniref:Short-chain dehydrogenase/reductase SDR n=1 Tax=Fimbriiglobus ruber TaxID=1908690 RepID=A0A225DGQ4_9BACT|nr:SDR family oxidoreductase [Fimbriiglobus ruber]OWK35287.1 Short-chain dehydrogenase/reductase SDR [Fimbriiglobus ruber]
MSAKLKKIQDQVVVVTGASSGIGLATAELLAAKGASVVLAARSGETLDEVVARITARGGKAIAVTCDVTDRVQVDRLAAAAVETFGRIDTWVNNAGLGFWGRLDETPEADARKLFDVNFWGLVNGCLAALPHLKKQGGALINVGSEVSEAYAPLQGMYVATKHAVKGYTDCLRVEIEKVDQAPVAVTLIQPGATDTPFPQHARNVTDQEPKLPDPQDDPQHVAEAILAAAEMPTREKKVSTSASLHVMLSKFAGGMLDRLSGKSVSKMHYDEPPRNPKGALNQPSEASGVAGQARGTGGKEPK